MMNRFRIWLVGFVGISLFCGATKVTKGESYLLSGDKPDQDKTHLAAESEGGYSWTHNYFDDLNENGLYDPGEPWDDTVDGSWEHPTVAFDNSCWMASAGNMVKYTFGDDYYMSWAYDDGIPVTVDPPWGSTAYHLHLWPEGGYQHYALEHAGTPWQVMANGSSIFSWVDPVGFIKANLREGCPLGIAIWGEGSSDLAHALTLYGIDTDTLQLTIADSDQDLNGQNLTTYDYEFAPDGRLRMVYDGLLTNVDYLSAFDIIGWWVGGAGNWHDASNWASRHQPNGTNIAYLTQSNLGTVEVDDSGFARKIIIDCPTLNGMLIRSEAELAVNTDVVVGETQKGLINHTEGEISINGLLELGKESGSEGEYRLANGMVNAAIIHVGCQGAGKLTQQNGELAASSWMKLGDQAGSSGTCTQIGGTTNVNGDLWIGYEGTGTYELSGTGSLSAEYERLGSATNAKGTVTQSGGTHAVSNLLSIGHASGGEGQYDLSGGSLSAQMEYIGESGKGTLNQTGGINQISHHLYLGVNANSEGIYNHSDGTNTVGSLFIMAAGQNSKGTYHMTGKASLTANYMYVGKGGEALFDQQAGQTMLENASHYPGCLYVGDGETQGSGAVALSGGSFVAGWEYIGHQGTGTFRQSGGTHTVSHEMTLGFHSGYTGTYELTGGSLNAEWIDIGGRGNGVFTQTGGEAILDTLHLCDLAGSTGSYTLQNGVVIVEDEEIGYNGNASFTQTGGTHTVHGSTVLAHFAGTQGSYTLSGGVFQTDQLHIGSSGTGTFNLRGLGDLRTASVVVSYDGQGSFTQDNGNHSCSGAVVLAQQAAANATYTMNGGTADFDLLVVGDKGNGRFFLNNGTLTSDWNKIGEFGTGEFTQTGGTYIMRNLNLAVEAGSQGSYTLTDGTMTLEHMLVGISGQGTFHLDGGTITADWQDIGYNAGCGAELIQTDGSNQTRIMVLGKSANSSGTYRMDGGSLEVVETLNVGEWGNGTFHLNNGTFISDCINLGCDGEGGGEFVQTDGIHQNTTLVLARRPNTEGTYRISGGTLETGTLIVGGEGTGRFSIEQSSAEIFIREKLALCANGSLDAVAGATIHMTGSIFENTCTNEAEMCGLSNLTLIFEGGPEDLDPFEAACRDLGPEMIGFQNNFAFDTLTLGGTNGIGRLWLRDRCDNQPDWEGEESLYVRHLVLGEGSYLNLSGLNIYYLTMFDNGATIDYFSGELIQIPEPTVLTLLTFSLAIIPPLQSTKT